jgi:hypothetical protein
MPNTERLKLIQSIIDRMALTSALLSLAVTRHDQSIAAIAIYVLAAMATLDAYYLALERAYRQLYRQASAEPDTEWALQINKIGPTAVARALTSPSILLLYGLSLTAILAAIVTT